MGRLLYVSGALFCIVAAGLFLLPSSEKSAPAEKLIVFHAGSLSVPFREIGRAFSSQHPHIRVVREAAGSRTCARKIVDLRKPCDVFGSSDYTVIDDLLILHAARWSLRFATNEMVIAYRSTSQRATELTPENWFEILCDPAVRYGRSDPDSDPCGYRTVLLLKLAERHYKQPGLARKLLAKDKRYLRPKEVDLLALLEVGEIDYLFIYRSVAVQHRLRYLRLPDQVNLRNPAYASRYRRVAVQLSGTKPGERIVKRGSPIVYGVTIPLNAPNPKAALLFVKFLLKEDKGGRILQKNGQSPLRPARSSHFGELPEALRAFAAPVQDP